MNQNYWAVTVKASKNAIDAVEFALSEAGAEGTELDLLGKKQTEEIVSIVGYFPEKPEEELVREWLGNALEIYELPKESIVEIAISGVENLDWLAEWKKHWRPTETARFIVAPSWSEIETADKIVLRIEPGMAFGTGTHETTRLCLGAIEENYQPKNSFFDVGTGTGVLAIAAAKMQSKVQSPKSKVVACDTDVDSVKIAQENAEINGVADKIEFYVGSISEETPQFDFVAANLTADVIVPLLPLLVEKAEKTLILSGILHEQQDWVTNELNKLQISNLEIQAQGEWISILIKR
jgi:ribosomal protein L11 methyltransferase